MKAKRRKWLVTEVTARRVLQLRRPDGSTRRMVVRLGRPRRARIFRGDWVCPYDIVGAGRRLRRHATGIDAFQALSLALHIIQVELEVLRKESGFGEFYFLNEPGGTRIVEGCNMLVQKGTRTTRSALRTVRSGRTLPYAWRADRRRCRTRG